jgi:hypothetical protein
VYDDNNDNLSNFFVKFNEICWLGRIFPFESCLYEDIRFGWPANADQS